MNIAEKYGMSVKEAAEYFNLGEDTIRDLVRCNPKENFFMFVGRKLVIKRPCFERFLDEVNSI